jgi:hypothetical protein
MLYGQSFGYDLAYTRNIANIFGNWLNGIEVRHWNLTMVGAISVI